MNLENTNVTDVTIKEPENLITGTLKDGSQFKTYAPGIGLIQDQNLLLVEYGIVELE